MKLKELMDGIIDVPSKIDTTQDIQGIALDSRKLKPGFVFIAIKGVSEHGLVYLQQAKEKGASFVLYERQGSEGFELSQQGIDLVAVDSLSSKLGHIADRFYRSPSQALDIIGITGTNGKTSCSQFLLQLIADSGIIGTLGWGGQGDLNRTVNTTPDVLDVQNMLATFVRLKKQTVLMEVSSHGLQQGRVNDVCFKGAVFTNLSRDHLDYHGSMEAYLQAKLLLFKRPDLKFAVVNADDPYSEHFLAVTDKKVSRWAFSVLENNQMSRKQVDEYVSVEDVVFSLSGIAFIVCWRNEKVRVNTRIVGDFNLENILAVMTVLLAQGFSLSDVAEKVNSLEPVAGRMERFGGDGSPFVFVDYAHTPDALEKVLSGLRKYCQQKLWVVFGCGGNRDEGKRPLMGEIAEKLADHVVITNDNPRFENPEKIIHDILSGCTTQQVEVIKDRKQAIHSVIQRAENNDGIVIAGKGHEDYQDINGIKHSFSDQAVVSQALADRVKPS